MMKLLHLKKNLFLLKKKFYIKVKNKKKQMKY